MLTPERPKKIKGDRFIPSSVRRTLFDTSPDDEGPQGIAAESYSQALRAELFGDAPDSAIFSFSSPAPSTPTRSTSSSVTSTPGCSEASPMQCDPNGSNPNTPPRPSATPKARFPTGYLPRRLEFPVSPFRPQNADMKASRLRKISPTPSRILDAPGLPDNFYIDVLDYGSNHHLLVGLGSKVYLWSEVTHETTILACLPDTDVTSVRWLDETVAAVGTGRGEVLLFDAETCQTAHTMRHHVGRVGCLAWNPTLGQLASGGQDTTVVLADQRMGAVQTNTHHSGEVCGLRWSTDGSLLSTGGDDNRLAVWSTAVTHKPLMQNTLQAAVRAMAWSPHAHGILACGGGSADQRIHFYNATSGAALADVDTGAQVCSLLWSPNVNELISTHGFQHTNLLVWKYPRLTQVASLSGHQSRVLWLTGSPDGQTIVTGAADETIRFWDVFPPARPVPASGGSSALSMSMALANIR